MDYQHPIIQTKLKLHNLMMEDWYNSDLFSVQWWGIIIFLLIFYFVFIKLLDKKRTSKILLFGCLMAVASFTYEVGGTQFVFWAYIKRIVPIYPSPFVDALTVIPITYMYVFQYGHTWKKFMLLNLIATALLCFGFIPLLVVTKIYELGDNWSYFYNFPPWFISACVARALTLWWVNTEQKHKEAI
jgi:hypothetical protein